MEWLKRIYEKYLSKDPKLTNLVIILLIGILIMVIGGSLFGDSAKDKKQSTPIVQTSDKVNTGNMDYYYAEQLEKRLKAILEQIEGVGEVGTMITFESGSEIIPASDQKNRQTITEEADSQGGNRRVSQKEEESKVLMFNEAGGVQKPLILKEIQPKVKGVIVAAEGASDIKVKSDILEAVKTALGIPAHKVQVFVKQK